MSEDEAGRRLAAVVGDKDYAQSGAYWSWSNDSEAFVNTPSDEVQVCDFETRQAAPSALRSLPRGASCTLPIPVCCVVLVAGWTSDGASAVACTQHPVVAPRVERRAAGKQTCHNMPKASKG